MQKASDRTRPNLFLISKIVGFVTVPSNAIGLLGLLGLGLLLLRRMQAGLSALVAATVLLLVFGLSPVGTVMMLGLSERFPSWSAQGGAPDGIIVLGGGIESELTEARQSLEVNTAAERVFAMLDLARRYPKARLVFSGGSGNLLARSVSEAPLAGALLDQYGLGHGRVVLEDRSRTTAENADFTRRLILPQPGQRWLLVTSAYHMPRAMAAFRAAGFSVEAYPVDFRSEGWRDAAQPFDKISSGLARSDVAAHEWIGLLGLWMTGRSSELFPGPR